MAATKVSELTFNRTTVECKFGKSNGKSRQGNPSF